MVLPTAKACSQPGTGAFLRFSTLIVIRVAVLLDQERETGWRAKSAGRARRRLQMARAHVKPMGRPRKAELSWLRAVTLEETPVTWGAM
jgi:hypothetical protein